MAVEAINRKQGVVLMVGGHLWPISKWLDDNGNECDEPDAVFAIVGPCHDETRPEFWVTLDISEFESVTTQ